MKTNTEKKTKSGLLSRPEPLSTTNPRRIDFIRRKANRALDTEKLLALMESEAPKFFEIAEVVGKWIWIQFTDKQPAQAIFWFSRSSFCKDFRGISSPDITNFEWRERNWKVACAGRARVHARDLH